MNAVSSTDVDVQLVARVSDFLYREAKLLDTRQFDEWLSMYAEDATYSIPIDAEADPIRRVSVMYEDKRRLAERVLRLDSGFAYSQEPASHTVHLVGNVRVAGEDGDLVHVTSTLVLVESRRGRQRVYAGQVDHTLRVGGSGYEIVFKEIRLVNSDLPLGNLTFLL